MELQKVKVAPSKESKEKRRRRFLEEAMNPAPAPHCSSSALQPSAIVSRDPESNFINARIRDSLLQSREK